MENNLIYVNDSIFTKTPHIYLNLNTSIERIYMLVKMQNLKKT